MPAPAVRPNALLNSRTFPKLKIFALATKIF